MIYGLSLGGCFCLFVANNSCDVADAAAAAAAWLPLVGLEDVGELVFLLDISISISIPVEKNTVPH